MNKPEHTLQPLDEYIRQSEPEQRERGQAWCVAIGLQQVDGLTTSDYLLDTARRHIDGETSIIEAKALIDSCYQSVSSRHEVENDRTEKAAGAMAGGYLSWNRTKTIDHVDSA